MSHISIIFPFKWPQVKWGFLTTGSLGPRSVDGFQASDLNGVTQRSASSMAFHVHLGSPGLVGWNLPEHPEASQTHRVFTFKRAMWKIGKMDENPVFFQQIRF